MRSRLAFRPTMFWESRFPCCVHTFAHTFRRTQSRQFAHTIIITEKKHVSEIQSKSSPAPHTCTSQWRTAKCVPARSELSVFSRNHEVPLGVRWSEIIRECVRRACTQFFFSITRTSNLWIPTWWQWWFRQNAAALSEFRTTNSLRTTNSRTAVFRTIDSCLFGFNDARIANTLKWAVRIRGTLRRSAETAETAEAA